MSETNITNRPEAIRSRADAVDLWRHLLGRGISFHWEDDPAVWVDEHQRKCLSSREAGTVRRLFREVALLDDPRCYDDALSLFKLVTLTGMETLNRVPLRHAAAFERCGSPEEAMAILASLQ